MNRLQNSIVLFLKYVTELENLIFFIKYRVPILLQSILHSRQVPSIGFAMQESEWRPCTTGSHWIVIVYLSRNGRNLKLLLLLSLLLLYTNILIVTEHKSHSNLTTRTYKPEDNLNMNKTCAKYTRFSIWIIPHWRRMQTSFLDSVPLGTSCGHLSIYLSIGRCE